MMHDRPSPDSILPESDIESTSEPFVGCWNRLVSTTNWEKGRIIFEWRESLITAAAQATEYSDLRWNHRVGGISSQHVGRLRRVHGRFGAVRKDYPDLYWSHFQAALDWNDAEMWLEGSVQNSWSVSEMRRQRWNALGAPPDLRPNEDDVIAVHYDEDVNSALDPVLETLSSSVQDIKDPAGKVRNETPPREKSGVRDSQNQKSDSAHPLDHKTDAVASSQVFDHFPLLPRDVAHGFEAFKRAIVRHKRAGWKQVASDTVRASLDALKKLVLEGAPE